MSEIYLPKLIDKISDFVPGLKNNWQDYEAHKAETEADNVHGLQDLVAALTGLFGMEIGQNENGSWVRWNNGLQMCWHHAVNWPESMPATATGSLYRSSADLVWTYPKPFVDEPYADGSSSGYSWVNDAGGTNRDNTESYSFRVYRSTAATVNPTVRLWAIGWWKEPDIEGFTPAE